MEIFPLEYGFGDFSFEKWRFFLLKICSWRFFLENLFWRLNFWKKFNEDLFEKWRFFLFKDLFVEIFPWRFILEIFPLNFWKFLRRFVHGDFSFGIWFWRFFLWKMEIFPFEDLFMEIFPWRFILRDLWRFFLLKMDNFFYDHKVKKMKID